MLAMTMIAALAPFTSPSVHTSIDSAPAVSTSSAVSAADSLLQTQIDRVGGGLTLQATSYSSLDARFMVAGPVFETATNSVFSLVTAEFMGEILPATEPVLDGNRIVYEQSGLTEWWVSEGSSFEQGWTVTQAPADGNTSLTLEVGVAGAVAELVSPTDAILTSQDGSRVSYRDLHAFDSEGTPLAASLATDGQTITITVNAEGAVYPVTIDPIIDADQRILSPDHATGDQFGESVASFGNLLAVSARGANDLGADVGRVDIFEWSGTSWDLQDSVFPENTTTNVAFGYDVAINADTLVVGAPDHDENGTDSGAVFVFTRAGTTWSYNQTIYECIATIAVPCGDTATLAINQAHFGRSLAISDSGRIIVGAPERGIAGETYIYDPTPAAGDPWLTVPDGDLNVAKSSGDRFGEAVDISPDGLFAIVGSPGSTEGGLSERGRATLFENSGGTWTAVAATTGPGGLANQHYGAAVAVGLSSLGDPIVVVGGPYGTREHFGSGTGGVRVLRWGGTFLNAVGIGDVSAPAAGNNRFGFSVDFLNDTVLVGAPNGSAGDGFGGYAEAYDYDAVNNRMVGGASADALAPPSDFAVEPQDQYGFSVAISPTPDLFVIGSPGNDEPQNGRIGADAGRAASYQPGGATTNVYSATAESRVGERMGQAISISGNRMAVSASGDDQAGSGLGAVHMYERANATAPWTFDTALTYSFSAAFTGAQYGFSLDLEGDWLAVGSLGQTSTVDVYFHDGTDWTLFQEIPATCSNCRFGWDVAILENGEKLYVSEPNPIDVTSVVYQYGNQGSSFSVNNLIFPVTPVAGDNFGASIDADYEAGSTTDVRLVIGRATAPAAVVYGQTTAAFSPLTLLANLTAATPADSVAIDGDRIVYASRDQSPDSLVVVDANADGSFAERQIFSGDLVEDNFSEANGFVDVDGDVVVVGIDPTESNVGIFYNDPTYGWGLDEGLGWGSGPSDTVEPGSVFVSDRFGASVAIDGLSIVAGAPFDDGGATESGGAFALEYSPAALTQPTNKVEPRFFGSSLLGRRIVVQGSTALVAEPGTGSAVLLDLVGSDWVFRNNITITPSTIVDVDYLADGRISILTNSGVANFQETCSPTCVISAVSSPNLDFTGITSGSVSIVGPDVVVAINNNGLAQPVEQYVFATGSQIVAPAPPDYEAGDAFGIDSAASGDLLFISSPRWDNAPADNEGRVYVYNAATRTFVDTIGLPAGETGDLFGWSVAASDDRVVVGHPGGSGSTFNGGTAQVGLVHVFTNAAGYALEQTLNTQFADTANFMGNAVDIDGNIIVAGSSAAGEIGVPYRAGAAYSFNFDGNVWTETDVYRASDDAPGDLFGEDVAIAGQQVLVGAPEDDNAQGENAGAVYYYTASPAVPAVNDDPALTFDLTLGAGNTGSVTVAPTGVSVSDFNPELLEEAADDATSIASAPLSSTDAAGTTLDSVPISSLPISSLAVDPNSPLSSIPVVELGLNRPGGWPKLFADAGSSLGDIPINDIKLSDVFAPGEPAGGTLQSLPISSLDVGGTPISSLPISSLYLGGLNLNQISTTVDWCGILAGFVDGTCDPANISLFEATISGVPISSLPISSLPISSLPISSLPISSLPISSLNLAASPISSLPISSLPISSLPISSLPISSLPISSLDLSGTPISSLPISSLDLSGTPISSLPISSLPISSLKLRSVPISSLPISSLPISSLPISSLPISSLFIADAPISTLPISSLSGYTSWCDYLADLDLGYDCSYAANETTFLTSTSIADLGLRGIPISSLPISSLPISSLPISSLPISSLPISSLPISSLPISSLPISSLNLAGTPISSLDVHGASLADVPISSLDVAGSPISSLPISSLPISSLPISSLPISSLPISSLPISSLPISSLVINGSPISSLPISSLDLADTPISSLPISSLPISSLGIDCNLVNCGVDSLFDAVQAGAVNPANVSIGDLQPYLGNIRLSDIADEILTASRQDVIDALAADTTQLDQLSGYANMTLGELPLTDALVANLSLGDLNDALWAVRYSDLVGALIDPSTGQPFSAADATAALEGFRGAGLVSDLLHFGDMTFEDFFANGTGTVTFADLGPLLALIHTDDLANVTNGAGTFGNAELGGLTLAELLGVPQFDAITLLELFDAANTNDALEGFDIADFLLVLLGVDAVPFSDLDFTEVSTGQLPPTVVPAVSFTAPFEVTNTDVARPVEVTVQIPGTASYAPNSSTVTAPAEAPEPAEPVVSGNTLTWTFESIPASGQYDLNFDVTPTVTLGSTNLSATARIVGTEVSASAVNVVSVVEPLEPNDFPTVTNVSQDTVYLTYISSETDNDVFSISVADNDEIAVQLSSLSADLDFALYGRPLDASVGAALSGTSDAAAIQPILNPDQVGTTSEPVDDFRRLDEEDPTLELIGVSNAPGTETELLVAEALPAGTYFVQVFGANGATNSDPAALQIQIKQAEARPACSNVGTVSGTLGSPAAGGETPNTIFLVNTQRMEHFYGAAGLTTIADVNSFATYLSSGAGASLGIDPLVISVDGYPAIQSAYGSWDGDVNCSPESANAVVAAIGDMLDAQGYRANLEHIVVVGGDPIVPMARLLDATEVANEYDYRHEFLGDNLLGNADNINSLSASFWDSVYLSDEPYGETSAQDLGNRFLYVSDVALGRLVETPAEISDMLTHFQTFNGELEAATAAVLGYDFLVDSSQEIAADLAAAGLAVDDSLADGLAGTEKWTRVDAEGKVIPAGGAPDLISLNGHFDHYRALPADGDKVPNFTDNFLSETVLNAADGILTSSIVFSMGCHSGLSVSDLQIGDGTNNTNGDWAQTFADDQAIFIGNTGFGYGDTEAVAYSERLMALFAEGAVRPTALPTGGQTTIGQALTFAKNTYASDLSVFSVYDEKALMEMTFYGLPFYTVNLTPAAAAPVPTNVTAPDSTTLETLGVTSQTSNNSEVTDRGVVYSNPDENGDPQNIVSPGRPIQPSQSVDVSVVNPADSTELGQVAHGALILNMDSTYVAPVDPVIAAVVFNEADDAPEPPVGDVVFPSKPVTINTSTTPGGDRQTLVLATGQFNSDGNTQRLDDNINTVVYYSDPTDTDFNAPTIGVVQSTLASNDQLTVTVNAADAEGSVTRIYIVAVGDPGTGSRTWTGVDLTQTAGTDQWSGSLSVPGSPSVVNFMVQAVDSSGNVGFATNKARNFDDDGTVVVDPPSPDLSTTVVGPFDAGVQWYTGNVTVDVTLPPELTATYTVTPGVSNAPLTGTSFPINGNGTFQWQVTTSDGQSNSGTVNIDTVAPTVSLSPPTDATFYTVSEVPNIGFTCNDPSLVSCVATVSFAGGPPTALANGDQLPNAPGSYSVIVVATDVFGNTASAAAGYAVVADPLEPLTAVASTATLFPGLTVYTDDVLVTVDGDGSPVTYAYDGVDQGAVPASGEFTVTAEGTTIVTVTRPFDNDVVTLIIEIDRLAPVVTIAAPVDAAEFEVSLVPTVEFLCTDQNLDTCLATVDGVPIVTGAQLPDAIGAHVVSVTGTDTLGRATTVTTSYTVVADPLAALVVTVSADNLFPGGTLYTGPVEVTVDGDGSPTEYTLNGGTPIPVPPSGVFTITAEGLTDFVVSRPADGLFETGSVTIDTTDPVVVLVTPVDGDVYNPLTAVNVSFSCTDAHLVSCVADVDGTPIADGDVLPSVVGGPYVVTVTGTDEVGRIVTATADYSVAFGAFSAIASTDNLIAGTTLYSDDVEVTVDAGGGAAEYQLDGGTAVPVPASGVFTVTAEGTTVVTVTRPSDSATATLTIEIDRIAPDVTLVAPLNGDVFEVSSVPNIGFTCADVNLVSCLADVGGTPIVDGAALPAVVGGPYLVTVTGLDEAGLTTNVTASYTVVADPLAPLTVSVSADNLFPGGTLYVGPVEVTVDGDGSPTEYSLNGAAAVAVPPSGVFTITAEGLTDFVVTRPADGATESGSVTIDTTDPVAILTTPVDGDVYDPLTTVNVSFSCTDAHLVSCVADVDGTPIADGDPLPNTVGGPYVVTVTGTDEVGLTGMATASYSVELGAFSAVASTDNLVPGTTIYSDSVEITVDSGGAAAEYQLDGGTAVPVPASGVFTVTAEGTTMVTVTRPSDNASQSLIIEIDRLAPEVTLTSPVNGDVFELSSPGNISFSCSDANLTSCLADVDGAPIADGDVLPSVVGGPYVVTVTGTDDVGRATVATASYTVVADPIGNLVVTVSTDNLFPGGTLYTGPVEVTVDGDGSPTEYSLNGAPAVPVPAGGVFTITAEGMTSFEVTRPADGASTSGSVTIDTTDPAVTISAPTDGDVFITGAVPAVGFVCTDANLESCDATVDGVPIFDGDALPDAIGGPYVVTVTGADSVGRSVTATASYSVIAGGGGVVISEVDIDGVALPGDRIDLWGEFTGGVAPYTVTIDWGDGSTCPNSGSCSATAPTATDPGMIEADYIYPSGGVFSVVVTVTDALGSSQSVTLTTASCTITGNNRSNTLYGTSGDDVICGLGGNDTIFGRGGNDLIYGGSGRDRIYGQGGDDVIYGGRGNDYLVGQAGNDIIIGGRGNDSMFGQAGNDILKGRQDNDRLFGASGDDLLIGNRGADRLYGDSGNDNLQGRGGDDQLFGQNGDDVISGGGGWDLVYGGNDNDTISGDAGHDNLNGGRGDDSIDGGEGNDRCRGNAGNDTLTTCEF